MYAYVFHKFHVVMTDHLFSDIASRSNAKGIFDLPCAKLLLKLPDVHTVLASTTLLRDVDLEMLKGKEEKTCFYGNLQNLMTVHMCLDLVWKSMSQPEVISYT